MRGQNPIAAGSPYPCRSVSVPLLLPLKRSEAAGAALQGCCSPACCRNGWLQPRGELAPCSSPRRRLCPTHPAHGPPPALRAPALPHSKASSVQAAGTAIIIIMYWSRQISISSVTGMIKCVPCSPVMKDSSVKSRHQGLFLCKFEISLTHGAKQSLSVYKCGQQFCMKDFPAGNCSFIRINI